MDFEKFVDCVEEGYTAHVGNWSTKRDHVDGKKKSFTVTSEYQGWNKNDYVAEPHHCAAIINGLFSSGEMDISRIWCAKQHNHDFIHDNSEKSTSYTQRNPLEDEWLPKDPDISFSDKGKPHPNWFCQVKFDLHSHVKAVQALGDFFWGAVTKLLFHKHNRREIEYVFVWSEHSSERNNSGFIHFVEDKGEMELRLSPGFTRGEFGKCEFPQKDDKNPWWDSERAILEPNNYTTIKQILAAGTNGTFVRMFQQHGEMRVKSQYKQLFIPTGNDEGWHVYVHRLMPASTYELLNSKREEELTVDKILHWIP